MSNLSNKFDILRGWPDGSAIEESFQLSTASTLVEGLMIVEDSVHAGYVILPTSIPANGAVTGPEKFRMIIQGNDQFDGAFTQKCVTLRGDFTVQTDQFVYDAGMTPGTLVTVSVAADATKGQLIKEAGNAQVVGEIESIASDHSSIIVSMSI